MAALSTSERLACYSCGSTRFHKVVTLRFSPTTGVSEVPDGLRCEACSSDMDQGRMVERHKIRMRRDELKAAEAEQAEFERLEKAADSKANVVKK